MTAERRYWQTPVMPRLDVGDAARIRQALRVYLHDQDRAADARDWDTAEAFVEWLEGEAAERPYSIPAGRPGRLRLTV